MSDDRITVLYCCCYGGWRLSPKAASLLGRNEYGTRYRSRHDPKLVEIWQELGAEFDGKHSKTKAQYVLAKYADFYNISEYDGSETISIRYEDYQVDQISNILDATKQTDSEKLAAIRRVVESCVESNAIVDELPEYPPVLK